MLAGRRALVRGGARIISFAEAVISAPNNSLASITMMGWPAYVAKFFRVRLGCDNKGAQTRDVLGVSLFEKAVHSS